VGESGGYGIEIEDWLSQSSKRVSARVASSPGTSVRSPSFAPKCASGSDTVFYWFMSQMR